MGTVHGICPTLVMRKFDGVDVLSRLWMVFSWGDGEGEEEPSGQVPLSRFRMRHVVSNNPIFYVILDILISVGQGLLSSLIG